MRLLLRRRQSLSLYCAHKQHSRPWLRIGVPWELSILAWQPQIHIWVLPKPVSPSFPSSAQRPYQQAGTIFRRKFPSFFVTQPPFFLDEERARLCTVQVSSGCWLRHLGPPSPVQSQSVSWHCSLEQLFVSSFFHRNHLFPTATANYIILAEAAFQWFSDPCIS